MAEISLNITGTQTNNITYSSKDNLPFAIPNDTGGKKFYAKLENKNKTIDFTVPQINGEFSLGSFKDNFVKKFYQHKDTQDTLVPNKIKIDSVDTNKNFTPPTEPLLPLINNINDEPTLYYFGKNPTKFANGFPQKPDFPYTLNIEEIFSKGILPNYALSLNKEDVVIKHQLCNRDHALWKSKAGDDSNCYYNMQIVYGFDYTYTITGQVHTHKFDTQIDKDNDSIVETKTYKLYRYGRRSSTQAYQVTAPKEGGAWVNSKDKSNGYWYGNFASRDGCLALNITNTLNNNKLGNLPSGARIKIKGILKSNKFIPKSGNLYIHSFADTGFYFVSKDPVDIGSPDPNSKICKSDEDLKAWVVSNVSNSFKDSLAGTFIVFELRFTADHTYYYFPNLANFTLQRQNVINQDSVNIYIDKIKTDIENKINIDVQNFLTYGPEYEPTKKDPDKNYVHTTDTTDPMNSGKAAVALIRKKYDVHRNTPNHETLKVDKPGRCNFTYNTTSINFDTGIQFEFCPEIYIKQITLTQSNPPGDTGNDSLTFNCIPIQPFTNPLIRNKWILQP